MADEGGEDAPVLFRSSRANRKLRSRPASTIDEAEVSEGVPTTEKPEINAAAPSTAEDPEGGVTSAKKAKSKLSFDDASPVRRSFLSFCT